MNGRVSERLRRLVEQRARGRCEYCLLHADDAMLPHEPDHIIAIKHRGKTEEDNLAWACFLCNRFKGSDVASIDAETGSVVRLFNPRIDAWHDHFRLEEGRIIALTPVGRVTAFLLQFNLRENIAFRKALTDCGRYPR